MQKSGTVLEVFVYTLLWKNLKQHNQALIVKYVPEAWRLNDFTWGFPASSPLSSTPHRFLCGYSVSSGEGAQGPPMS